MLAARVQAALSCSGRAVCRWLNLSRGILSYQPKPLPEAKQKLELEIVRVSQAHPTLGYKKITRKLVELGYGVNKKQVQRIRREEGLQVPPPKPRQRRRGVSTGLPQQAGHRNHVWAWDFVSDYTERGGKLRMFNLIDEYTRECHSIHADRTIKAEDVLGVLAEAIEQHGMPEYIRSDNGPEFIARALRDWIAAVGAKTAYIMPGSPWENGYCESFNSKLRDELLNGEIFYTLKEARIVIERWRRHYNTIRPHSSLGYRPPAPEALQWPASQPGPASPATPAIAPRPTLN